MARPRLAALQRALGEVARAARRRPRRQAAPDRSPPDDRTADELVRRLDATRERLRNEIPPRDD
jgi:hypothetical protein